MLQDGGGSSRAMTLSPYCSQWGDPWVTEDAPPLTAPPPRIYMICSADTSQHGLSQVRSCVLSILGTPLFEHSLFAVLATGFVDHLRTSTPQPHIDNPDLKSTSCSSSATGCLIKSARQKHFCEIAASTIVSWSGHLSASIFFSLHVLIRLIEVST